MQLKLSKDTTTLTVAALLISSLILALYLPGIPFVLFMSGPTAISLILVSLHLYGVTQEQAAKLAAVSEPTNSTTIEQRSAEEIIGEKLKGGAIEKAIDLQFTKMIDNVVSDLFGNHGDIQRKIKNKLNEQMNPYIEKHDFAEHNVKLELLLNNMVTAITKDQSQIIQNARTLMGLNPIGEISATLLFDRYCKYVGEEIDEKQLEINYDDTPTYRNLTTRMETTNERSYGSNSERKTLSFTCEEDEALNIDVELHRWEDIGDRKWHISRVIRRETDDKRRAYQSDKNILSLENPISAMRDMNELDIFLIKLHQDHAVIELDEEEIDDDSVEVAAEPECSLS